MMLVGSLPAESSESALRQAAGLFGDMVAALPDGETGPRASWSRYEKTTLTSPDIEPIPGQDPSASPGRSLFGKRADRIRPGVTRIRWETWPRIDDAIESHRLLCRLRAEGVIPPGVRLQVGLPFPYSANASRFREPADYLIAEAAYIDLAVRELGRLFATVPADDLAIQWEAASEFLLLQGVFPFTRFDTAPAWERFAGAVRQLAGRVPGQALMGFHLCHGTEPQWPMHEPRDLSLLVQAANYAVAKAGRPVDWLHLAGPPLLRSQDELFYRPLAGLVPGAARVFLGIVLPADGADGIRRRAETAAHYLDGDFGVAFYCGLGRQAGADGPAAMREHARSVREYLQQR
jgi:hypothetical protein